MATDSAAASGGPASSGVMDKGLKKGAIGYVSNIVIGVASTAPAYSLAATLGFIVAVKGVGGHAVRMGDPLVRPIVGLDERLGDLPRRPDRDGLAGGHRRHLHVQAVRLH